MSDSIKLKYLAEPTRYSEEAYASLRERLLTVERIYAKGAPKFEHLFSFMASAHENLGLIAYFTRGDMAAFKQHWHLSARLRCHAARHIPPSDDYTTGGYMKAEFQLLFSLLSESPVATHEASTLETYHLLKYRDNPRAREYTFHIAQLVIRNDHEAAQAKIEMGARKAGGNLKKAYAAGTDFYSLLMKGDKAALEASIVDYIKIDKKDTLPTICDFVYPVVTFRTKLCWYKGIPVEIEHPMVPMDWMPISPLPHYDDIYDFLSPDWTPPDQSMIARLKRKFQKDFPSVDRCMERVRRIDAAP